MFLEQNQRVFVYEDNLWVVKGCYDAALAFAVGPKSQLIDLLGISAHLIGSGEVSLPLAYQKYKAFLVAHQTLNNMANNWTWPIK